ncbi:MAG TPA: hypothetical protein V6C91_01415 [Coleofasciculaceae cyanobacterium]
MTAYSCPGLHHVYLMFTCGAWLGVLGLVLAGVAIAGTACYGFTYLDYSRLD